MNAFARGKSGNQSIYVPTRSGVPVQRSTGTSVPSVVRGMKRMVQEFRDRERWVVLDAIATNRKWTPPGTTKARRFALTDAYRYHVANRISELEAILSDKNLSEHLDAWIEWVRSNRHEDVRTADVYWQQVTTLVKPGEAFPASKLEKVGVMKWLTSREGTSSGTKRKYFYALKSFIRYLLDAGVLETDPIAGLKAPKKDPARKRWVTADIDETIVANALDEYQAFFAFVKGTGCDVGAARRAQKGDVNLFRGVTDVRGTKTDRRQVHQATIEPWALPYIKAHLKAMGNADRSTLLFPGITNSGAGHHHKHVCGKLNIEGYTLKDARHSVGVRMRKAGKSFEEIAAQLGTSVYQTVTVYSRYTLDEQIDQQREAK